MAGLVRLLFVLCLTGAVGAHAAPSFRGQGHFWVGPGFDSNASRDFVTQGRYTSGDFFGYALFSLEGRLAWERARLTGSYDLGTRKFVFLPSQDSLIQSAQLEGNVALGRVFGLGLSLRGRDRRGASRDYSDVLGLLAVDFFPDPKLDVRLTLGAERFFFWQRSSYGYAAPQGQLAARFRFDRRHSVSASGGYGHRFYDGVVNDHPDTPDDESAAGTRRADGVVQVSLGYQYRGPFMAQVGYAYSEQASNSFGESLRRHRLTLTGGFRLPWELSLFAQGVLQLSQFPDGIYLSPELLVIEDDENSSYLTAKLVRALGPSFEVDLRYAAYLNVLPGSGAGFVYARHVVSLGVALNF